MQIRHCTRNWYNLVKAATNFDMLLRRYRYRAKDMGRNMMACAKMMGITPAAFTFRGIYCRTPPYCLLPTIRFAYCTGILRVPCTSKILTTNTRNRKTISTRNATSPPCPFSRAVKFTEYGKGQPGDNPDHNDQGNTVPDSFIGNSFTQPHNKYGSGGKNDDGGNLEHSRVS